MSIEQQNREAFAAFAAFVHLWEESRQRHSAKPAPVQKKLNGWWAHTNPETGLVDVVNYQLTQADKAHGWLEQEIYTTPPAQPAVPDAFGTREGEHPQYIQGWNDCRAEMLRGMK